MTGTTQAEGSGGTAETRAAMPGPAAADLAPLPLFDALPDAIFVVDAAGRIRRVNDGAVDMFGRPREDLVGARIEILMPERFRERHPGHVVRYCADPVRRPTGTGMELFGLRADGREFPVDVSLSPIELGEDLLVMAAVRDASDRRRLEKKLRASNADLEQFAYVASHDLQEPLRTVSSFLQLLERQCGDRVGEEGRRYIGHAVDAARRMKILIEDLLAYSRVGQRAAQDGPVSCSEVLDMVLADLRTALDETGAVVTRGSLPEVHADAVEMRQLFQNLISNAIKFRSDAAPRVHVSAERHGNDWVFSVRDNGIGIEPAHAERIFEVFERLHGRADYEGTGIGLALCQKIVNRHGGKIRVESEVGRGATFRFTIPVRPPPSS